MRIISDKGVESLLDSLDLDGIHTYQDALQEALRQYHFDPSMIPERTIINKPELTKAVHIFMPSFTENSAGIKTLGGSKEGFKGCLLILDKDNGHVNGVVNATTLTAFRTALASTLPLKKFFQEERHNQEITVYGNGLQAYWHVNLTLKLYPSSFKSVQIVVRSKNEKSMSLETRLKSDFPQINFILVEDSPDVNLSHSSVIYGCIPSTKPSIHLSQLNDRDQVFISIIGSYKPHMFEVDDGIVLKSKTNGKIIVDSYEHTLAEAGELIKNRVEKKNVIEIGELEYIDKEDIVDFSKSNIILSKIVGLSIMDLTVGSSILQTAIKKNVGIETDF
ncbi:hypothetical protein WICMUC_002158 [Wickerhamomyces mucosus]|uniref:Ornithine cyclodeaminase n=1 Tax=Wickerhamomyces mucosus TaxID=1378264 RepID=A0A9P8PQ31_9ASCO|nr:hypothetical protein WICMUC_002158 [Wickerhamomyces mucosus]